MPSVAVIGTRGYPSYYGGFETAMRKIAPHLADAGWDVTVYCRHDAVHPDHSGDPRVATRVTPGMETKSLSTLSYGLTSTFDAAVRRPDVALVMNVANGYFLPLLAARGIPSLVNVDGLEWNRDKWNTFAKKVFYQGAHLTARWATGLVFDARAIEDHWQQTFAATGTFIPYGGDVPPPLPVPDGLTHRGYVLVVARFVPENSVPQFLEAVDTIAPHHPVVIVGTTGYGGALDETARAMADKWPSVTWLGHVSDDALLLSLWQHAGVYFHGHSVGGTNPALVQAMAAGAPVLARDTVYNREGLGAAGRFVPGDSSAIARSILELMKDPATLDEMGKANQARAEHDYSWHGVCSAYEQALRSLASRNQPAIDRLPSPPRR